MFGFSPVEVAIVGVALAVGITLQCLFLRTLSKVLRSCSKANRRMNPGLVWLNLIPFFGIVWMFVTAVRVSGSLKAEFEHRGMVEKGDYGLGLGIGFNVAYLASAIPSMTFMSFFGLALWIGYWSNMSRYRRTLTHWGKVAKALSPKGRPVLAH